MKGKPKVMFTKYLLSFFPYFIFLTVGFFFTRVRMNISHTTSISLPYIYLMTSDVKINSTCITISALLIMLHLLLMSYISRVCAYILRQGYSFIKQKQLMPTAH